MSTPHDIPAPPDGRLTAAHTAIAAALLIAAAILGWLDLQAFMLSLGERYAYHDHAAANTAVANDPTAGLGLPGLSSSTHRPLNREPLNLAPLPDAEHIYRFTTREGVWTNEVSLWRIPASALPAVLDHYAKQARGAGLDLQSPQLSGAEHRTWFDRQDPPRTLTVSLIRAERRDEVHAVVWLRYAIQPADVSGGVPRHPAPHEEAAHP